MRVRNNAKFYLLNSWSNLHSSNESSQIHYHGNSLLSGVYYPIFPKNSGDISFFKTGSYTNIFHQSIRFEYDEDTHVNTEMYKLEVNEGKVVIFPSHLEHKVEQNLSKEKRYSIAFNFFVKGKFGKEEYILELK